MKSVKFFNVVTNIFFLLLMIASVVTSLTLKVESNYGNTVNHGNWLYYMLAVIGMVVIVLICAFLKDMPKTVYIVLSAVIVLAVALLWQIPIGRWIYYWLGAGDFGAPMGAAIGFNEGQSFLDWTYFKECPNNANLTIVLSWVYRIIPKWRFVIILGALLTNFSALFVEMTTYKITRSRTISLITLVISEGIMAMTWRAFIVYTDNFGMIFVALFIWGIAFFENDKYKTIFVLIVSGIGFFIKPTILICAIAYLLYKFFVILDTKGAKAKLYKSVCIIVVFALSVGAALGFQTITRNHYKLDTSDIAIKGGAYHFMLGQNTGAWGLTNGEDPKIYNSLVEAAIAESDGNGYDTKKVGKQMTEIAINRIKERGIKGNIVFFKNKLGLVYVDGYFHNVQAKNSPVSNELKRNLFYELLVRADGRYYQVSASLLQIAWNLILVSMLIFSLMNIKGEDERNSIIALVVLGATAYIMIFEGRSKYLYMFLPAFCAEFGIAIRKISYWIGEKIKK